MCSERISNIKDLVRLSTKATLTVPAFLLTDAIDNFESYNDFAVRYIDIILLIISTEMIVI